MQEAGVDEPDRAKTDGHLLVYLRGGTLVVDDVSGPSPREVGTFDLPEGLGPEWGGAELLLAGDTVLVVGTPFPRVWGGPSGPVDGGVAVDALPGRFLPPMPGPEQQNTRLLEVSVSDPAHPRLVSDQELGGSLVSARQYGGTVRLVLRTSSPTLDFVYPNRNRTEKEAAAENRRIVRESSIGDWLPTVRLGQGERTPLVACGDVRHPATDSGFGTVTIVTLPVEDPTDRDATAVTAAGETVYSSTDRLYLATSSSTLPGPLPEPGPAAGASGGAEAGADGGPRTDLHAFALDGPRTTYVASGEVRGWVRDRWSLDEVDGLLRVAVSYGGDWNPRESGIEVLREDGRDLAVVGSVRGLGPDEQIKAVRWFDRMAVVVTFRQTDPLYAVDLTDPRHPRTLGALKLTGFSTYLHPVGDDRLVGIGQAADRVGRVVGGQASVFDVSNPARPALLDRLSLGAHANPVVGWEPRAFTWLADERTALTTVSDDWAGRARLVALRIGTDGTLTRAGWWPVGGVAPGEARALPLGGGKVALVTDGVRLLDVG